ncbi:hypothetical protein MXL54_08435 [Enterobacteriaceae bacterium G50]|nr:hypothetical protein [Enterobacteriaceae bacterium G50]
MKKYILLILSVSLLQGCASYYSLQEGCSKGDKAQCEELAKRDYYMGSMNAGIEASNRQRLIDAQIRHLDHDNLYPVTTNTGVTTNCYRNGVDGSVTCRSL